MSALLAYKLHAVPKSTVAFCTQHLWKIPSHFQDCFSSSFLLYWESSYFFQQLNLGTIKKNSVVYQVIYVGTSPAKLRVASQIALSFRIPSTEFGIPPTVLVKKAEG